jgi:hypothetical protein
MLTQPEEDEAFQLQPANVATSTVRRPPPNPIVSAERLSENRHGAAACVSSMRSLPTVIAPERGAATVLEATTYPIDASPWPDRAPVIVSQLASVPTVQVQSRAVFTATVPFPPFAVNVEMLVEA